MSDMIVEEVSLHNAYGLHAHITPANFTFVNVSLVQKNDFKQRGEPLRSIICNEK